MTEEVFTRSAEETEDLGERMGKELAPGMVVVLEGVLGSGKTTFVKGIARGLGIKERVTSSSFTIISEYEGPFPLVHIDLYRTNSDEELELLGLGEIIAGNAVYIIEWGEKARSFIPAHTKEVSIGIDANGNRKIEIREPGVPPGNPLN